jgi:hypothetical protein
MVALAIARVSKPGSLLERLNPFLAGAGPGLFNVGFARKKELATGVPLYEDADATRPVPTASSVQNPLFLTPAYHAWMLVWATRVAIAAPTSGGTALFMAGFEQLFINPRLASKPWLKRLLLPITLLTYAATVTCTIPVAVALWPRVQPISVGSLSAEERLKLPKDWEPKKELWYVKGT